VDFIYEYLEYNFLTTSFRLRRKKEIPTTPLCCFNAIESAYTRVSLSLDTFIALAKIMKVTRLTWERHFHNPSLRITKFRVPGHGV